MQNIIDILKGFGIEVPEDKTEELNKQVSANYKTVSEFDKKIGKVEQERDSFKAQLDAAQETLKGFEGIDIKDIQTQLDSWKQKAADAEKHAAEQIAARDFEDALKEKFAGLKFSSEAAKKAVFAEIKAKGLKLDNGVILGFDDAIKQIKEADASAFVDDANPPARFTSAFTQQPSGKKYASAEEIFKIKDATERQTAMAENPQLFFKN